MQRPRMAVLIASTALAVILFALPVLIQGGRTVDKPQIQPLVETIGPGGLPPNAEAAALRKLELARTGLLATPNDIRRGASVSPDPDFPRILVLDSPRPKEVPDLRKHTPEPIRHSTVPRAPGREGLTPAERDKLDQYLRTHGREGK